MNQHSHQQRIAETFNRAAAGYDLPPLRFFRLIAERLVAIADLQPGQSVLDIGTGTALAAIAAAKAVGSSGRVIGIDLAAAMLEHARANISAAGLGNVEVREMDATRLDFPDGHFDAVLASLVIFLMPDEMAALKEWQRILKPGGKIALSVFGEEAFQPMSDLYVTRLQSSGVRFKEARRPFATQKITTPEQCREMLAAAGFHGIAVHSKQLGYYLDGVDEWWDVIWNSGFRSAFERLEESRHSEVKAEYLSDVAKLLTSDGLWVDVAMLCAVGQR